MSQFDKVELISQQQLKEYIKEAAMAAGYIDFGADDCDIKKTTWWAAYIRQSLEEQSQNNRIPDYLLTCAREAKKLGVVIPTDLVIYDAVTGEHLERPGIIRLRHLMAERKISGIVFPALDRLSREPLHQQIFEMEAAHYGIQLYYADAPSGNDPGSQFARSILAHAAKLVKLANRKNAVGGNIGRVVKGWVPAHRASYGYRYCRDAEIDPDGRVIIKRAWWEIDELDPDGTLLWGSPAWVVVQIFNWIGIEDRTLYWVARKLNTMGIKAPAGGRWSPARVQNLVRHHCYTGSHFYNANTKVSNPEKPLGDITAEVKRTLIRPKPKEEWVAFRIPELVSEEVWQKANKVLTERGRGRGKQGRSIQALLRGRIFCPRCGKPMLVRRDSRQKHIYYHCSKYFRTWDDKRCAYSRFVPATVWENLVWDAVCALLEDDAWLELQLDSGQSQQENRTKLLRTHQFRISQAEARISKIHEGFEAGIYDVDEAKGRILQYQETINRAKAEIQKLQKQVESIDISTIDIEAAKRGLKALRHRNLDKATPEDKLEIITKLGIRVYPSDDLKSVRITCGLKIEFENDGGNGREIECGKVMIGPP